MAADYDSETPTPHSLVGDSALRFKEITAAAADTRGCFERVAAASETAGKSDVGSAALLSLRNRCSGDCLGLKCKGYC